MTSLYDITHNSTLYFQNESCSSQYETSVCGTTVGLVVLEKIKSPTWQLLFIQTASSRSGETGPSLAIFAKETYGKRELPKSLTASEMCQAA